MPGSKWRNTQNLPVVITCFPGSFYSNKGAVYINKVNVKQPQFVLVTL